MVVIKRSYYAGMLAVVLVLGFTGVMGGYAPVLGGMFLILLVIFMGGFLHEVDEKIGEDRGDEE